MVPPGTVWVVLENILAVIHVNKHINLTLNLILRWFSIWVVATQSFFDIFTPNLGGFMIQFDLRIFFKGVEKNQQRVKIPSSNRKVLLFQRQWSVKELADALTTWWQRPKEWICKLMLFCDNQGSTNSSLVVWGPVVWIFGISLWKDCYVGLPQTINH